MGRHAPGGHQSRSATERPAGGACCLPSPPSRCALTIKGTKLTTGLGWWRRHEADDGSGLVEHLGGGGAYRNLMRLYPASGRAVVMFGNLTSYPVEHLTEAVLRADPPRPRPAG